MRAVLLGDLVCGYLPHLRESLRTEWELVTVMDAAGEDERRRALSGAEAILAVRWTAADQAPSGLRLLQVAAAGYDTIDLATVPPQVPVCNAFGHEPAIGEYAVMAMLAWCHRFLPATRELRDGRWVLTMQERPVHAELAGKQVLEIEPGFRVSVFTSWYPLRRPGDLERFTEGLRLAGLPE